MGQIITYEILSTLISIYRNNQDRWISLLCTKALFFYLAILSFLKLHENSWFAIIFNPRGTSQFMKALLNARTYSIVRCFDSSDSSDLRFIHFPRYYSSAFITNMKAHRTHNIYKVLFHRCEQLPITSGKSLN